MAPSVASFADLLASAVSEPGTLSDASFEKAEAQLGFNRLLDVVATVGFYTAVALAVNVFEVDPNPAFPSVLAP